MTRTYLPTRPPQGIEGPHGHGYHPDKDGNLRDVDRLNASTWGVQGAVSTAHDVSAFQRALAQGKLTDPPKSPPTPPEGAPRLCGGEPALQAVARSAPGFTAVTFTSPDGRRQFALSIK
jgi:D-alanyl-D-alanine carboxypeptidase